MELFAARAVASALIRPPDLLAQLVLTPLLTGWSIWIAMVISTRATDMRVAQQFAVLASLPSIAVTSLLTGVAAAAALLLLDRIGWALASALLDRERLVTGAR
ncbi:hypothetical protein [Actinoplanes sp. NPDC049599]|uniref:hypothetical protein n=1 Tax=Actinoplanes sp. NPDC049599 TaxID=3363903 RepID=UPI0037B44C19